MLNTKKKIENRILTVSLNGRLDSTTVPFFEDELRAMFDGLNGIIFDLTNLEYISSAGLRVFLKAQKYINNVVIKNPQKAVEEVFHLTGFDKMLNIQYDN